MKDFAQRCRDFMVRKFDALIGITLLFGIWWFNARMINEGFDLNMDLIKLVCRLYPSYVGDKIESFLRFFNTEKLLLVEESHLLVWLFRQLLTLPYKFQERKGTVTPATTA